MAGQILAVGSTFSISDGSTTVAVNEVQSLVATGASSGTFVLSYSGGYGSYATGAQTTSALAFGSTASQVQTALVALPNIGNNTAGLPNVLCAGGPLPTTPVTITFQNDLAGQNVPQITVPTATMLLVGGTAIVTTATPGTSAGGVYAALAALTDMVFPNTKKDVKEITNFDSAGYTKEYIGGFINPGDVSMNAMWNGGATQDWRTGIISKFYNGSSYAMKTNVPNKTPQPGVFTPGMSISFNGFFTDGSPGGAKHDDILTVKGSVQISGIPVFGMPTQ
jgi:hypothetical protein